MPERKDYLYDTATALALGRRDRQEDALTAHFPAGRGLGYVVLADGMGGHAAGDLASSAVVEAISEALQSHSAHPETLESDVGSILRQALQRANARLAFLAKTHPDRQGMGSTVVAPVIVDNRLYWISVGDSPLYLLRGTRLCRLNEEHSMARHMEKMVQSGRITRQQAERHPDRDCVTSVLHGTTIAEIDCQDEPLELIDGDIVIAASDGLQIIDETRIAALVYANRDRPSAEIGACLMQEIAEVDDPDQDNVSLCVVKFAAVDRQAMAPRPAAPREATARGANLTRTTVHLNLRRKNKTISCQYSSVREG